MNILLLNASPRAARSQSRRTASEVVARLQAAHPAATLVERDLGRESVPPIDEAWIAAAYTPEDRRTPDMKEKLRLSDELIDEFLAADTIVLATPMHNFGITPNLKAWIDQVVRVNRTFAMPGPRGLAVGRKLYAVVASGGSYGPGQEHLTPFLRQVFSFIGITDVTFIPAVNGAAQFPAELQPPVTASAA